MIEERIGFQTADAIANLTALSAAVATFNRRLTTLNSKASQPSKQITGFAANLNKVATSATKATAGVKKTTSTMQTAGTIGKRAGDSLTLSWQTFARVIQTQLIVRAISSVTQALGEAARKFGDFEVLTTQIANITREGAGSVNALRDSFVELSKSTGRSIEEVTAAGLEALQNDLGTTAETMDLLGGAADNLAKATGSDLTSSINSLSSVIKSYNVDASEAANITDTLYVAYDKGRVKLEELESRLGTITPAAADLGLKFTDVAAATAAITLNGTNAQLAMTQLRNVLLKLEKPTKELQDAFTQLDVKNGQELIQKFGGLEGALKALLTTSGGNNRELAIMFSRIRAILGILALTNNEGVNFNKILTAMENKLGRAAAAAAEVNKTLKVKLDKEYQKLNATLLHLGANLIKLKIGAVQFTNAFIQGLGALDRKLQPVYEKVHDFFELWARLFQPSTFIRLDRVEALKASMDSLADSAEANGKRISEAFAKERTHVEQLFTREDAKSAYDTLSKMEEAARLNLSKIRTQLEHTKAALDINKVAFEDYGRIIRNQTTAATFDIKPAQQESFVKTIQNFEAGLKEVVDKAASATTQEEISRLQRILALTKRRGDILRSLVGSQSEIGQAIAGQFNAASQLLNANVKQKTLTKEQTSEEKKAKTAAKQKAAAITEGTKALGEDVPKAANEASSAIKNIPDPEISTQAAIAQMRALTAVALETISTILRAQAAAAAATAYHGRYIHRASGGPSRGQDTVPALLSPGEFVINRRSSGRFFSQLQAINAGQAPAYRESGGTVTNIGDINVNMQSSGEVSTQTARQVASGIRRELRRKTSRLS